MNILINYAHESHYTAQAFNTKSGYLYGFDKVIKYGRYSLPSQFIEDHTHILSQEKGAGYWLWKPWIILDAFNNANPGDFIFYCDSGSEFIASIDPLIAICDQYSSVLFHTDPVPGNIEAQQTKRDAFILMDCDEEDYVNAVPVHAGFQIYKRSDENVNFLEEYLYYCQDHRIIMDGDNVMGKPNYPGFIQHRHDQSVLSLLRSQWRFKTFRDPTQYGNPYIADGEYDQIINHTRNRS